MNFTAVEKKIAFSHRWKLLTGNNKKKVQKYYSYFWVSQTFFELLTLLNKYVKWKHFLLSFNNLKEVTCKILLFVRKVGVFRIIFYGFRDISDNRVAMYFFFVGFYFLNWRLHGNGFLITHFLSNRGQKYLNLRIILLKDVTELQNFEY